MPLESMWIGNLIPGLSMQEPHRDVPPDKVPPPKHPPDVIPFDPDEEPDFPPSGPPIKDPQKDDWRVRCRLIGMDEAVRSAHLMV